MRLRLGLHGSVQGMGFRPFVYRLALSLELQGFVRNNSGSIDLEIEGPGVRVREFLSRLQKERPPHSEIDEIRCESVPCTGQRRFEILPSPGDGTCDRVVRLLPDIATCAECIEELFDPQNRRYRYPFTNCTLCGPRYSIIERLPYDRERTSMRRFNMCPRCMAEYADPASRRFHAQTNCCPECGPQVEFCRSGGQFAERRGSEALQAAVEEIRRGGILAVKGVGGFLFMADARRDEIVTELRRRKRRPDKPFALMYPSLESLRQDFSVSEVEAAELVSCRSPIVLLRPAGGGAFSPLINPAVPCCGVMLPYTPLFSILMQDLGFPVIATSGNFSEEPICTDTEEALYRLSSIADAFLTHDREIVRRADDSVVHEVGGRMQVLRSGRGCAPQTFKVAGKGTRLALGGQLKSAVAVCRDGAGLLSPHIGDLESAECFEAFKRMIAGFTTGAAGDADEIVCDQHPAYLSSQFAETAGKPLVRVQHHAAHALSCMLDNSLDGPVLAIVWDGTGFGPDRTVWGGEFLLMSDGTFTRLAHLRPFRLPGGEQAVIDCRRPALGVLSALFGLELQEHLPPALEFSEEEFRVFSSMLEKGINSPLTTSAGRLFDAVAGIMGVCRLQSFEGQAPMALEALIDPCGGTESYQFAISGESVLLMDWQPCILSMLEDLKRGVAAARICRKFHNALIQAAVALARRIGQKRVIMSGGCFQNRYLSNQMIQALREAGFEPYWHRQIPPNDGGIAAGQLAAGLPGD